MGEVHVCSSSTHNQNNNDSGGVAIPPINRYSRQMPKQTHRVNKAIISKEVRVIALLITRGVSGWLKVQDQYSAVFTSLSFAINNLIKELEQWKV